MVYTVSSRITGKMSNFSKYFWTLLYIALNLYLNQTASVLLFYPSVILTALIFGVGPGVLMLLATAAGFYHHFDTLINKDFISYFASSTVILSFILHFKKNEILSLEREEKLRIATESSQVGIWELDLKTNKIATTVFHDKAFGYNTPVEGWSYDMFLRHVHPDDISVVSAALNNVKNTGKLSLEFRVVWPDKTIHWMMMTGKAVFDKSKKVRRILGTNFDISEKKTFQESLQEALFYRDEFLSIASHELKTPLTSLKLQSQLFKRNVNRKDPEAFSKTKINRFVDEADKQVSRLVRLVDDMLDISRIRTGRFSINKEYFNLAEVTHEVVDRMRPHFQDYPNSHVPLSVKAQNVEVYLDKMRIEQVICNLLLNAKKYGCGKPVSVEVNQLQQIVEIHVNDNGMGIAPQNHERIFNRFQRAVPASEVSGLGLGLYITRQIVHAHGGQIKVESELNKGSKFTVEIPLELQ